MDKQKLIFVYNANSDLFSTVTDFAHKIFSPATYGCGLCALTYGNFSMKQEWKTFIENLPFDTVFLHKDEFQKQYGSNVQLPAIFISVNNALSEIISRQELERCKTLDELKSLVSQKTQEHVQHHHPHL